MKNFNQKVAAITGAGSGIGQQLAILLAQQGTHLALSDVNEQGLVETRSLIAQYPVNATFTQLDVSNQEAIRAWAADSFTHHGKINLIFNNAGVALASTVEGMNYEEMEWIFNINFWGVVYGTKEFLPYLKQSGEGHVINISSLFGLTAQPTQSAYNATKFAVRGFTEALRQELDIQNNGVSATCVHPGGIRTNIANNARMSDSIRALGMNPARASRSFNKVLKTPPSDAAKIILDAVRKNKARILIGTDAKILDVVQRITPTHYSQALNFLTKKSQKNGK
ncbi:SDR family NAD(P)-dependent oxidoreductase [Acinetobacter sp. ANC 4805]|uniref:SDR family NAD(P)-dependent oxidoreductase n=1 Tax=Acinetobacter sp. ANC 4805 TaxID=2923425 RepID=UPI001F4B44CF|nr:SDR family NAD(P)-dependent oxidoreductase [Acinetobacter sp. ANC 4805]MCH7311508.1 SDR family NAD(P)-dependent oxidoreductase [Acinetobacter sp. ANC 4805]